MSLIPVFSSYFIEEEINKSTSKTICIISNKITKKKYFLIQYSKISLIEVNEIRILNSLRHNHRHLINCKEITYHIDDKTYNCITDYADNSSLHNYILQSVAQIKEEIIWQTLIQVLYGLLYLHNNGIIHRNIKPSNIYFHNDYREIKVGGFKLCEMLNEKSSLKHLPASLNYFYAAPEIINNEQYDMSSDIWSIGACIYEMCFISSEYKQPETYFNMLKGIIQPIPQSFSFELNKIIVSMLSIKPKSRLTCFQLLNNPIVLRNITNIHSHINCISQGNEKIDKIPLLEEINKDNISNHIIQKEYSLLSNETKTQIHPSNIIQTRLNLFSVKDKQKTGNNSYKSTKTQNKKENKKLNIVNKSELNGKKDMLMKKIADIHTSTRAKKSFKKDQTHLLQNNFTKSANAFFSTHRVSSPKVNNSYCLSHAGNNYNNNRKTPKNKNIVFLNN